MTNPDYSDAQAERQARAWCAAQEQAADPGCRKDYLLLWLEESAGFRPDAGQPDLSGQAQTARADWLSV
jgi:hypothetical protein